MTSTAEPFSARSWLFAPGDSERKMEKAAAGPADIVLLDLEDAVAEEGKPKSRAMISSFLADRSPEERGRLRGCGSTPWTAPTRWRTWRR